MGKRSIAGGIFRNGVHVVTCVFPWSGMDVGVWSWGWVPVVQCVWTFSFGHVPLPRRPPWVLLTII